MNGLIAHCGAEMVTLANVMAVPVPEATNTYQPIAHGDMAKQIRTMADNMLVPSGYAFQQDQYALGREGQRVFGIFRYQNGSEEMGLAVGWRNSYDKSMAAGVCIGAQVFVCDNLAFHGEVTILRRHTKNLHDDLMNQLCNALYRSQGNYISITRMADRFKTIQLNNREGYRTLGLLRGEGILTSTLESEAFRQWEKPEYEAFKPRNVWSLYNAATCALREAPVQEQFELHNGLSNLFTELWPEQLSA